MSKISSYNESKTVQISNYKNDSSSVLTLPQYEEYTLEKTLDEYFTDDEPKKGPSAWVKFLGAIETFGGLITLLFR